MKRFFLATLAIFLIVLSSVFYEVSNASAASPFDTTYKSVDSMILNDGGACSPALTPTDITTDWSQFITNSDNWNDPNNTTLQAMRTSFLKAVDSGRWGVSINQSQTSAYVFWTEDTSLALNWSADSSTRTIGAYSTTDSGVHTVSISQLCSFGLNKFGIMSFNYYTFHNIDGFYDVAKEDLAGTRIINNLFIYTDFPNYPDGYEGVIIPDSYAPPIQTDPLIDWWLTDKLVFNARYLDNLGIANTSWTWKIFSADDNFQITGDPIYTSDEIQGINMFTYTFAEKGKYIARASFHVPAPGLPPPSEVRTSIDIQLNVDGYYQRGGTNHCQDGICTVPVIDCKILPSIVDRLNCKVEQMISDHGLSAVVTAPLAFLTNLANTSCSPITLPLPTGNGITLECLSPLYRAHAPALLAIWQTVITGSVAYLVAINTFARIKGISNPKDDSIEVYKL